MAIKLAYSTTFRSFNVSQDCNFPVWFIDHKKETEDETLTLTREFVKAATIAEVWVYTSAVGFLQGRAMAQAVSRRPLNAEAWFSARVNPCAICGGQSGPGTVFSEFFGFPCQYHSTVVLQPMPSGG
jgi:hypothetical protein